MITYINIFFILIFAVLVPFLLGNLICIFNRDRCEGIAGNIAYGFMIMCVLFMFLAVPMIFMHMPFHILVYSWTILVCLLCIISIFVFIKKNRYRQLCKETGGFCRSISSDRFTLFIWIVAVLIILFEACLPTVRMHIDTDDARFIAEALEAVEKDTMLEYHAITGKYLGFAPGEQIKDVISPYPLFIALLSCLYRLHPAITAHTVLPFLLVILSYIVFGMIGNYLANGNVKKNGLYLLFLSLINLFSFETIYASGYTMLTIIWQGRSVCAMIMLPLLWYILLKISVKNKMGLYDYIMLVITALSCTMTSSMGSIFAPALIVTYALMHLMRRKTLKPFLFMCVCALPSLLCIVSTRIMRLFL